jgi:hypothetical protein
MNDLAMEPKPATPPSGAPAATRSPRSRRIRSLHDLLDPMDEIARHSPNLIRKPGGPVEGDPEGLKLPRYLFVGPQGGGETLRIGLFAAIHGDEPAGAQAIVRLAQLLDRNPEIARGYCLFLYPVCNPGGYEDGTRHSRSGKDLNREFWNHSREPEVLMLQSELWAHAFHGIISLHSDDTSDGIYGFVGGATLTEHLIEPAIQAATRVLPRNTSPVIDGFSAQDGIIREGYPGILAAPPQDRPKPFEIILETPSHAPLHLQEQAFVLALQSILVEYRQVLSYAANL